MEDDILLQTIASEPQRGGYQRPISPSRLHGTNWTFNGSAIEPWISTSNVLYHLTIFHLQDQMKQQIESLKHTDVISKAQLDDITTLLHQHSGFGVHLIPRKESLTSSSTATVIRDYRFMQNVEPTFPAYPKKGKISYLYNLLYTGPGAGPRSAADDEMWGQLKTAQEEFKNRQLRETIFRNLGTAAVGGLLLIVPMLAMTLYKSLATSLVTVSVAVLLFAVLVAVGSEVFGKSASPLELLVATAAYAAVLVVFVGNNNS